MIRKLILFLVLQLLLLEIYGQENLNTTLISHWAAGTATQTLLKENYLFVNYKHVIKVFDVTNINIPERVGEILVDCGYFEIVDDLLYALTQNGRVKIFDISDITNPTKVFSSEDIGIEYRRGGKICISNNKAYVVFESDSLSVLNVNDLNNVTELNRFKIESPNQFYSSDRIYVNDDFVYILKGFNGIKIYDLTDVLNPLPVTTIPALIHPIFGAKAVSDMVFKDQYAIIAHRSNGLLLVDISNPESPVNVNTFFTTSPHNYGFTTYGLKLFGDTLVLSNADEFVLIDFSNINEPNILAKYETYVDEIWVTNTDLYGGNFILNGYFFLQPISNSTYQIVYEYKPFQQANQSRYFNDHLAVSDESNGLYLFNIENPSQPKLLDILNIKSHYFEYWSNKLFVAKKDTGMRIFDVSNPISITQIVGYNQPISHFTIQNDTLYGVDNSTRKLLILDVHNVNNIVEVGSITMGKYPKKIILSGNYAYISTQPANCYVVDISNAAAPIIKDSLFSTSPLELLGIKDNLLFLSKSYLHLNIYDISDPLNIYEKGSIFLNDGPRDLSVSGDYCYVSANNTGLRTIDISDPANPTEVGSYSIAGNSKSISFDNNLIFLTNLNYGLYIFQNELLTSVETVEGDLNPPGDFLFQNYPNPFNPISNIRFSLEKRKTIALNIYDITGSKIKTLLEGDLDAGTYEIPFDGSNYSSGVYFYSLESADHILSRKMLLLK